MKLMGVDVGTTGVKAAVFDENGKMLGYGFREYDIIFGDDGTAEQDAEQIWGFTMDVMTAAASQSGGDIAAVSLSAQGDAVIPIDRNGKALCLAQLGMDYRGKTECAEIADLVGDAELFRKTGMRPHPMNSLVKIMWFSKNRPDLEDKIWKYTTYADFILLKMGSGEPVIDWTMASRTMCFDLKTASWSAEILNAAGIDKSLLSRPVPSGTAVGKLSAELCARLGIRPGARLVAGGHDQTCAALGAGIIGESTGLDSHGTAEVLSVMLEQPRLDNVMFRSFYPCYCSAVKGAYFTLALNHTGGLLLKWYSDNLGHAEKKAAETAGISAYTQIIDKMPVGPSPLLVLPHFNGSGTPVCDMNSKGAILGLTMSSTRHDIAKAILDSTAFELRLNLETMRKSGIRISRLRCVGGGARSPAGLQLKADVTGLPVSTLKIREAACLGAALLAGLGTGVYSSARDAAGLIQTENTFYPDSKMNLRYEKKYRVFDGLYGTLKDINHTIERW